MLFRAQARFISIQAINLLTEHFGIRTLLLEGGGHINGAFLEAGLVDEAQRPHCAWNRWTS